MSDATDFLLGGGGKAAKFEQLGDRVVGTITELKISQQTDMETGAPLTWADGSPRNQLVITLQTDERLDDNDDGVRRVYAKGGNYEVAEGKGKSMKDAIAEAVKASGAGKIEEGGKLTVGYSGNGKRTNRGFSAPKLFAAKYEAPTTSISEDDLFN